MSTLREHFLTVAAIRPETPDAASISFEVAPGDMPYVPGQFLTIEVNVGGRPERRSYSLCSAPGHDPLPTVAVKRVAGGKVSNYMLDELRVGDRLRVFNAMGNFVLRPNPSGPARHIVLIGAGSGITPLYSILKAVLLDEPQSFVSLIYGNREHSTVIFYDELAEWKARYPDRLNVVHVYSQRGPEGYVLPTCRMNPDLLLDLLTQVEPLAPVTGTEFFLCGPQALMDELTGCLTKAGHKQGTIHRESFFSDNLLKGGDDKAIAAAEAGHEGPSAVTIILEGRSYELSIAASQTILEAALDADIDMPYSCQSGLCTACRGRCLQGKVTMAETEGLSDSELAEGYVLTCVGHAATGRVVVEIG